MIIKLTLGMIVIVAIAIAFIWFVSRGFRAHREPWDDIADIQTQEELNKTRKKQ